MVNGLQAYFNVSKRNAPNIPRGLDCDVNSASKSRSLFLVSSFSDFDKTQKTEVLAKTDDSTSDGDINYEPAVQLRLKTSLESSNSTDESDHSLQLKRSKKFQFSKRLFKKSKKNKEKNSKFQTETSEQVIRRKR